ncbi:uncharacterized protein LOC122506423 [Leptopilina heterotoma]|uniref:uncharacterized protein LOC122506423 n=1 Tax=Leptopilina heterotoma TaxID=63436 RepID=UPI001CAA314F|nr:uncharacterized protein LOC122506423 [Leptopilina heterotoma]
MRTAILSLNITFFFLLCICYLHLGEVTADEICPKENCVSPEKCESLIRGKSPSCGNQRKVCCSVVKDEFRTHCRHHGGICMNRCAPQIQRDTTDCTDGQVCCVLV